MATAAEVERAGLLALADAVGTIRARFGVEYVPGARIRPDVLREPRRSAPAWRRRVLHNPPCRPGDRVRCVAPTAEELGGVELLGRVGTVERRVRFGGGDDWGWDVRVVWDGLLPRMRVHHDPKELEPAEDNRANARGRARPGGRPPPARDTPLGHGG